MDLGLISVHSSIILRSSFVLLTGKYTVWHEIIEVVPRRVGDAGPPAKY